MHRMTAAAKTYAILRWSISFPSFPDRKNKGHPWSVRCKHYVRRCDTCSRQGIQRRWVSCCKRDNYILPWLSFW